MSRIPKGSGREIAPEGTHNMALIQIIDLGTQPSNNPEWRDARKVQLGCELVDEETSDGNAVTIYRPFNYTSSPKGSLMAFLRSAFGIKEADFDMNDLLGKPFVGTIEHKETDKGTFANLISGSQLRKGDKVRKHTEPLVSLFLDETFEEEVFNDLPEFLREKIAGSKEYEDITRPQLKKKDKSRDAGKEKGKAAPAKKQGTAKGNIRRR